MNDITERFLMVYSYLLNSKTVKNKSEFAQNIGISSSMMTEIEKKRSNIGVISLQNTIKTYNINPLWLLTGEGEMIQVERQNSQNNLTSNGKNSLNIIGNNNFFKDTNKNTPHPIQAPCKTEPHEQPQGIPLIPLDAVAGFNNIDNEGITYESCEHYHIPEFTHKGAEFLIRVSGDSMQPLYFNGDILACKKVKDILFFQWGKVYVIDCSQGVMVKRIMQDHENKDHIICLSENDKHYHPFSMPKDDIRSLSTILGLLRVDG